MKSQFNNEVNIIFTNNGNHINISLDSFLFSLRLQVDDIKNWVSCNSIDLKSKVQSHSFWFLLNTTNVLFNWHKATLHGISKVKSDLHQRKVLFLHLVAYERHNPLWINEIWWVNNLDIYGFKLKKLIQNWNILIPPW